jgi:hypothetical protein
VLITSAVIRLASQDVFYWTEQTGVVRVSVDSEGLELTLPSDLVDLSLDGRWIMFNSIAPRIVEGDRNVRRDLFLFDRLTDKTTRVSLSSNGSELRNDTVSGAVASNGCLGVFDTTASAVPGDSNNLYDVHFYDRNTSTVARISESTLGGDPTGPSRYSTISDDGQWVAFWSAAPDLDPLGSPAQPGIYRAHVPQVYLPAADCN